ncbi:MAG: 3-phosphoserine/phosphohydroxythreonine transaminase [Planctomycetota bacterium]|nr:MAG: 3-phosphoserine/phosphohydroxythreonine transaminase [Planctomycetota bacterium]RLS96049.1 MAG: 3-phosphoserine/phosphohydroxythreonine transaminase [Planctomycetota bacterium]
MTTMTPAASHLARTLLPMTPSAGRVYNFSAGPACMPESVLQQIRAELLDCRGSGIGLLELSHRGAIYEALNNEAEDACRRAANAPSDYAVFFMPGGATVQFGLLPLNFIPLDGSAAYIDTSIWSAKAASEAARCRTTTIAFDGKACGYTRVPRTGDCTIDAQSKYLFYCQNNTVEGTTFWEPPETNVPLIGDATSDIFSRPWSVEKHAMILAAGQKNLGASGASLIIAKKDFIASATAKLPQILRFEDHANAGSRLNTPPTFAVRVMGLMAEWTLAVGGPSALAAHNAIKANLLWNTIDGSGGFYSWGAEKWCRSHMNICFRSPDAARDAKFVTEAEAAGLFGLLGHRDAGGMRASIYNAFPAQGCEILAQFMGEFARRNG